MQSSSSSRWRWVSPSLSPTSNPEGNVADAIYFAERGYAVVLQDCLGRYDSEGEYRHLSLPRPEGANECRECLERVSKLASGGSCPRTAPPGARRKTLVTAHGSAPGGAAPFAATRVRLNFAACS